GNVSIYAMEKAIELGATVIACSDSNGFIYDENGINLDTVKQLKEVEQRRIRDYTSIHPRSEEHTSELQSRFDLVCRLLLEKKKKKNQTDKEHTMKVCKRIDVLSCSLAYA